LRLGVNIDHIATIRQARRTFEPDPVKGAILAVEAGADQITLHLREDRRHIQDKDLFEIRKVITEVPINLEMAPTEEMKNIALTVRPDSITLVPEKREEITTEGGLDVVQLQEYLQNYIKNLKEAGIRVVFFIDPIFAQIDASVEAGADAVELHTGEYANAKGIEVDKQLDRLKKSATYAYEKGLKVFAGHGLTYQNVKPVASIPEIEELNIGHSIIANSVFWGIGEAVRRMKKLILEAREGR